MSIAKLNEAVETARKEILALMRSRGYTQKTSYQSALYETVFSKDGKAAFAISGWHGSGKPGTSRFYGPGKTLFSLYVIESYARHTVAVNLSPDFYLKGEIQDNVPEQEKVIREIIAYLKANA